MSKIILILPIKEPIVVFPHAFTPLYIEKGDAVDSLFSTVIEDRQAAIFLMDPTRNFADPTKNFRPVGTLVQIIKMMKEPDGSAKIMVEGVQRVRVVRFLQKYPIITAEVEEFPELPGADQQSAILIQSVKEYFQDYMSAAHPILWKEISVDILAEEDAGSLADSIAMYLNLNPELSISLLEAVSPMDRLNLIFSILDQKLQVKNVKEDIKQKLGRKLSAQEKKYVLREELKIIQGELEKEGVEELAGDSEMKELQKKIKTKSLPELARKAIDKEFKRLAKMNPASPEFSITRDYIDWILELPWEEGSEDKINIKKAEKILDRDHYGLEKVKERILEFLAVRKLSAAHSGAILCFAGPPGVGKTSIGKSIAESMNREFVHFSLGGMRDEAEIRGHRRTYIGSMPGRILQRLKRVRVNNPVMMLDEIDKLGADFRGDPASALLEVLDPEQNREFNDHYLDLPFDLSKCFFITTANELDTIPSPLLDRMEIIEFSGYTEEEKLAIVEKYLISKQIKDHGLTAGKLSFTKKAIQKIIREYTREAGLRNLERHIKKICRKVAREVVDNKRRKVNVTEAAILKYLGPEPYLDTEDSKIDRPGIIRGLAWTAAGGEVLYIESSKMPGGKNLKLTGQLGDVMKESAEAALSYLRAHQSKFKLPANFYEENDIHIHLPAGAIPKDGPSAGITLAISMISLFTGKMVKKDLAMTGEMTLTGRILPIGGVKEKTLAAIRSGVRTIIIPRANKNDILDLPKYVQKKVKFVFVETLDQAVKIAF